MSATTNQITASAAANASHTAVRPSNERGNGGGSADGRRCRPPRREPASGGAGKSLNAGRAYPPDRRSGRVFEFDRCTERGASRDSAQGGQDRGADYQDQNGVHRRSRQVPTERRGE